MKKFLKLFVFAIISLFSGFIGVNAATNKVIIHVMDTKANITNPVEVKTFTVYPGGSKRIDLDQIFKDNVGGPFNKMDEDEYFITGKNNGNYYYFDGWYDIEGKKIPTDTSYVVAEQDSEYVSFAQEVEGQTTTGSIKVYKHSLKIGIKSGITLTEDVNVYVYTRWTVKYTTRLNLNYIDNISTGSGSWANLQHVSALDHTFKKPESQPHYSFLYWEDEKTGDIYNPGDVFEYTFEKLDEQITDNVNIYAWWQPSVTLNLYSDGSLLSSQESFDSVSIDQTPSKPAYNFLGWSREENGSIIDETTFDAPQITKEPVEQKIINLYAVWERITTDIDITKNWVDNDNAKEARPDSIKIDFYEENTITDTIELNSDNWSTTVTVNKFNEDGSEINYSIKEQEVADYTSEVDGFTVTNTIKPDGKVIVNYVEKDTNKVIESDTLIDIVDRKYTTEAKDIENYEFLNEVDGEPNGTFTIDDIIINYYYKAVMGKVIVHYVDEEGNSISENDEYTAQTGTTYEISPKDIKNYELTDKVEGNTTGTYTKEDINITYYYKAILGTVIAHYVDVDGNKIADDQEYTGKIGEKYSTEQLEFGEYYLEDIKGSTDGEFTNGTIEVTYIYDLSGQGDIEPEENPGEIIPPQTGDEIDYYLACGIMTLFIPAIIFIKKESF